MINKIRPPELDKKERDAALIFCESFDGKSENRIPEEMISHLCEIGLIKMDSAGIYQKTDLINIVQENASKILPSMNYDEAVEAAILNPGQYFMGICFDAKSTYFSAYQISSSYEDEDYDEDYDEDDDESEHGFIGKPASVDIYCESAFLFDLGSEEKYYCLDDVPDEVKKLVFKGDKYCPDIIGYNSDYILSLLFPLDLPYSENLYNDEEKSKFIKTSDELLRLHWSQKSL